MGILSTLAAIGVGAAGVKVFERMKENNPQGFTNYIKEAEIAAKQLQGHSRRMRRKGREGV